MPRLKSPDRLPMLPPWARPGAVEGRLILTLHVQPHARSTGPTGRHGDALGFRVAAQAVDNRANEALLTHLRTTLGIPSTAVRIRHGFGSRRKPVEVERVDARVRACVAAWDDATRP